MALMRQALGVAPDGFGVDARLLEMSFGQWEGLRFEDVKARDAAALASRKSDRWNFVPPGGESYAQVMRRVADWHASLTQDCVVAAHLGTGRALLAHLRIAMPAEAVRARFDQNAVYLFAEGRLERFG
jgi:probable phosphoglycerate mutase